MLNLQQSSEFKNLYKSEIEAFLSSPKSKMLLKEIGNNIKILNITISTAMRRLLYCLQQTIK